MGSRPDPVRVLRVDDDEDDYLITREMLTGHERVRFEVASAKSYPGRDYDLVTMFDCLHDMGDPVGASAHVRETLKADGA